ncbi:hypothetical protein [Fodinicola feengrottensis]|nr:hypothetical protein [Fodinicola feengrottensis]
MSEGIGTGGASVRALAAAGPKPAAMMATDAAVAHSNLFTNTPIKDKAGSKILPCPDLYGHTGGSAAQMPRT